MRTVLLLLLLALPLTIQADSAAQVRQLEKALARLQQESQSIQQQFVMIQELRRNEMSEPAIAVPQPKIPGQSVPIPNYNDLMQSKQERDQRIIFDLGGKHWALIAVRSSACDFTPGSEVRTRGDREYRTPCSCVDV